MSDFLQGRVSSQDLPEDIQVFLIATCTGWSKDKIERLSKKDFITYSALAQLYNRYARSNAKV